MEEDRPYLSAMITDINLEEESCSYARLLSKEIENMESSGDEMDDSLIANNNNSQNINTSAEDMLSGGASTIAIDSSQMETTSSP